MNAEIFFFINNRNYINQYTFYSVQCVVMTINLINSDTKLISLDQSTIEVFPYMSPYIDNVNQILDN